MPKAGEVVVEGRLDHVVHVGNLPLQISALPDVALKREVVYLKMRRRMRCDFIKIQNEKAMKGQRTLQATNM